MGIQMNVNRFANKLNRDHCGKSELRVSLTWQKQRRGGNDDDGENGRQLSFAWQIISITIRFQPKHTSRELSMQLPMRETGRQWFGLPAFAHYANA